MVDSGPVANAFDSQLKQIAGSYLARLWTPYTISSSYHSKVVLKRGRSIKQDNQVLVYNNKNNSTKQS